MTPAEATCESASEATLVPTTDFHVTAPRAGSAVRDRPPPAGGRRRPHPGSPPGQRLLEVPGGRDPPLARRAHRDAALRRAPSGLLRRSRRSRPRLLRALGRGPDARARALLGRARANRTRDRRADVRTRRRHAAGRRRARPSDRVGPLRGGLLSKDGRAASRSVAVHAEWEDAASAGIRRGVRETGAYLI